MHTRIIDTNVLISALIKKGLTREIFVDFREEANKIMNKIDKDDVIFIACALAFDCSIWSDDKHFKKQKEIKVFTTKDILENYFKKNEKEN